MLCEEKARAEPLLQFLPRLEFLETCDLLVDPFQGSHENLLAVERMLGGPRDVLAAWLGLSFADATPAEGERALLVAELSER